MKTIRTSNLKKMSCGSEDTIFAIRDIEMMNKKSITVKEALKCLTEELIEQSYMLSSFQNDCWEDKDDFNNVFRIVNSDYGLDFSNWKEVQEVINNKLINIKILIKNIKILNKKL